MGTGQMGLASVLPAQGGGLHLGSPREAPSTEVHRRRPCPCSHQRPARPTLWPLHVSSGAPALSEGHVEVMLTGV